MQCWSDSSPICFLSLNLIFWNIMGDGIAHFGRSGLETIYTKKMWSRILLPGTSTQDPFKMCNACNLAHCEQLQRIRVANCDVDPPRCRWGRWRKRWREQNSDMELTVIQCSRCQWAFFQFQMRKSCQKKYWGSALLLIILRPSDRGLLA